MTLELLAQSNHLAVLAPEIVLSLCAMAILLGGAFFPEAQQRVLLPGIALAGVVLAGAAQVALWDKNLFFGPHIAGRDTAIFQADNFSLFFNFVFLTGLAVTVLISNRFLHARSGERRTVAGEYYGLLLLSTVGMMMVAGARDLLVVFLGIETLSIALYILAGFARAKLFSNEAALKYFLLGAFAAGFLLYGIAVIYYATGSTLLPNISRAANRIVEGSPGQPAAPGILYAGMALLLIGLGFKAALVPFHQWTPDVYEGSPTPITAFMAVGAKAAAFAAIVRIFAGTFGLVSAQWHGIVLVIAVLTMTIGNIVAIGQSSLKRMLAYSSIAHAGYLLVGVLAIGSALRNSQSEAAVAATAGVLFYLIVYALMNLGAFAVLVYLENERAALSTDGADDSEDADLSIDHLRGLAWRQPLLAAAFTVFLLSLAGIPPTAGFFGKLYIFQEGVRQGLVGLVLVGVLNSVISVYYYLRPVVTMYSGQGQGAPALLAANGDGAAAAVPRISIGLAVALVVCAVAVLGMIVLQGVVLDWATRAATIVSP